LKIGQKLTLVKQVKKKKNLTYTWNYCRQHWNNRWRI